MAELYTNRDPGVTAGAGREITTHKALPESPGKLGREKSEKHGMVWIRRDLREHLVAQNELGLGRFGVCVKKITS